MNLGGSVKNKFAKIEKYIKDKFSDENTDLKFRIKKNDKEVIMILKNYDYNERTISLDGDDKLKNELSRKYDLSPINEEELNNFIFDMMMDEKYDVDAI